MSVKYTYKYTLPTHIDRGISCITNSLTAWLTVTSYCTMYNVHPVYDIDTSPHTAYPMMNHCIENRNVLSSSVTA